MADLDLTEGEFVELAGRLDDIGAEASAAKAAESTLGAAAAAMPGSTSEGRLGPAGAGLDTRLQDLVDALDDLALDAVLAEEALHGADAAGEQRFGTGGGGALVPQMQ